MTFVFDWFSLIFAIIIIFYLIIGIVKGTGYIFLNFFVAYAIIIVSLILGRIFGPMIGNATGLNGFLAPGIQNFLEMASPLFGTNNPGRLLVADAVSAGGYAALTNAGIPDFLGPLFLALVLPNVPMQATTIPVSQYAAESIVSLIFVAVAFFVFYTVLSIIHEIIKAKIRKKHKKEKEEGIYKKPNALSRVIGAIFGLLAGAIIVFMILWIFNITMLQSVQMRPFFAFVWGLDDPSVMTIRKWLLTNNPFSDVLAWIFKLFNI